MMTIKNIANHLKIIWGWVRPGTVCGPFRYHKGFVLKYPAGWQSLSELTLHTSCGTQGHSQKSKAQNAFPIPLAPEVSRELDCIIRSAAKEKKLIRLFEIPLVINLIIIF